MSRLKFHAASILFVLTGYTLQASVQQSSTLQGIVIDSETNRPIAKVAVELRSTTGEVLHVSATREDGRFAIPNVLPRQYKLTASRNGYVYAGLGDRAGRGRNVTITSAAPSDVQFALVRTTSISGRVTDRARQPLVNVSIQALQLSYEDGKRSLNTVASTRTNDLGEYRLYWLPPGRYYVRALPVATTPFLDVPGAAVDNNPGAPDAPRGRVDSLTILNRNALPLPAAATSFGRRASDTDAFATMYVPGTTNEAEATPLDLQPGQDFRGADLTLAPVRLLKIKGVVIDDLTGSPAQQSRITRVRLPAAGTYFGDEVDQTDGRFEIIAPAGQYSLFAYTTTLMGRADVEVKDRDLENLIIRIKEPAPLPAKIYIDGRTAPGGPEMSSLRVHLAVVPDLPGSTQINGKPDDGGSLTLPYIQTADYRVVVEPFEGIPPQANSAAGSRRPPALVGRDGSRDGPLPPISNSPNRPFGALPPLPVSLSNAYVKTIRFANKELPNGVVPIDAQAFDQQKRDPQALEIVIGTDGGSVQGAVPNSANARVVLIPNDPLRSRLDLYKSTVTDGSGRFRITAIAPGDYKAFAWSFVESSAWLDPSFLRLYEDRGSPIHVNAGAVSTANLTLIP